MMRLEASWGPGPATPQAEAGAIHVWRIDLTTPMALEFLRRWHDIPTRESHEVPSPKRMIFGQPIPELRQQQPKEGADLPSGPRPGATGEASSGQPPPGSAPREAR